MCSIYHLLLVLHSHEFVQGALGTCYILQVSVHLGCRVCRVLHHHLILHFYGQKVQNRVF